MAKELITVIVPVYKIKEEYLRRCFDSLMDQGSVLYKVIIVDDGSPDNSGIICDEYADKCDFFQVIHQSNAGVSVARNTGMDATETEWVTFVDPDDWLDMGAIKKEIETIIMAKNADIIMFDYSREYVGTSHKESLSIKSGFLDDDWNRACKMAPFYKLTNGGVSNPYSINALWNKIYRKSFLYEHKIRFIPEAKKGQDRLFNAAAFNATDNIYYLNNHLYNYLCNEESVSNKYNENIVDLTLIEIRELERVINQYNLQVKNLLNARICTRLYSCMRLYFFHHDNPDSMSVRKQKIRKLVTNKPFSDALHDVDVKLLSLPERLFVFCIKHEMFLFCKILVGLKSSSFSNRLNR